jgi:hypothetical protein
MTIQKSFSPSAAIQQTIGSGPRSLSPVSDFKNRAKRRRSTAIRILVFAIGIFLGLSGAFLFYLICILTIIHHLRNQQRQFLIATENGLILGEFNTKKGYIIKNWPPDTEVSLHLTVGEPVISVVLPGWTGFTQGTDLTLIETTIRAGAGEPLRVLKKS